jgi:hypothetical protein
VLEEPGPAVGLLKKAEKLGEGLFALYGKRHPLRGQAGVPAVHLLHAL